MGTKNLLREAFVLCAQGALVFVAMSGVVAAFGLLVFAVRFTLRCIVG